MLLLRLSGRFYKEKEVVYLALYKYIFVTAIANDYGYDNIYSRMVEFQKKSDILIGLQLHNSKNVLMLFLSQSKLEWLLFTGKVLWNGSDMWWQWYDPSINTPRIQECYIW